MVTLTKCKCQHCNQNIEFDSDNAGATIPCPNCGMETMLFVVAASPRPAPRAALAPPKMAPCPDCAKSISKRAVVCPNCGMVPSLWRIGWYVLCISGAMSIITGIVYAVLWAINDVSKSM